MELKEAQDSFLKLLDGVQAKAIPEFLQWINASFGFDPPPASETSVEQEAAIRTIIADIRPRLPHNSILPSETQIWPSDFDEKTSVHQDAFLFDDDDLEKMEEEGNLERRFCTACGSHKTAPLTFFSHSFSLFQLKYVFQTLLPPEMLKGKLVVDVGSRLGAVLFSGFVFSPGAKLVGVEFNRDLAQIQQEIVTTHGMSERVAVVFADVRNCPELLSQADVLVLNNPFQFFLSTEAQKECWELIRKCAKRGVALVTHPSLRELVEHLNLALESWADEIPTEGTAAKFCAAEEELLSDVAQICLYQVK